VTVSAVPDEESPDVGGLQNTATNLGAAVGTALAGSILIAALTASFLQGVVADPRVPTKVSAAASTKLASGVPFLSDRDLIAALRGSEAGEQLRAAVLDANRRARIDGLASALFLLALLAVVALFATGRIPDRPVGSAADAGPPDQASAPD
jgi:hypothetical protein